jgi:hypothetical protein
MKKAESEQAIRRLCHQWRTEAGRDNTPAADLVFGEFFAWLTGGLYSGYLNFRTTTSVPYDVEMWFDQEFKQTGRR